MVYRNEKAKKGEGCFFYADVWDSETDFIALGTCKNVAFNQLKKYTNLDTSVCRLNVTNLLSNQKIHYLNEPKNKML